MSTALSTAFTFQARARDRLYHVLLHPEVETWMRSGRKAFWFPSHVVQDETGVAVDDQVTGHRVPFAPVRPLVPAEHPEVLNALSDGSWEESWGLLLRV
ncbi:MAG: hypothetical protein ACFB50_15250, partial [Rubrobacteraceae bacterium]